MTGLMKLRDYQQEAVDAVKAARERGVNRQLLALPTGSGKTVVSAHIQQEFAEMPCVFVCHREELINQTVDKFLMNTPNLRIRVCQGDRGKSGRDLRGADVIVASAQTIARKNRLASVLAARGTGGLVISDECFVAGTLVDGVPIQDIEVGMEVTAFTTIQKKHLALRKRKVTAVMNRPAPDRLFRITSGGTTVVATANHPFYTKRGWIGAGSLSLIDEVLLYAQDWQVALPTDSDSLQDVPGGNAYPEMASREAHNMQPSVPLGQCITGDVSHQQGSCQCPHENQQPDGKAGCSGEGGGYPQGDRAQAASAGRQREANTGTADGPVHGVGRRVGIGSGHSDQSAGGDGVSNRLQGGHREPISQGGYRSGWGQSFIVGKAGARRKEDSPLAWARVDRIEVLKPGSDGEYERVCPDGKVYNLEVIGDHTYIANGFVVHNCHHYAGNSWASAVAALNPDLLVGMTATPKRGDGVQLSGMFDEIVYSKDIKWMVQHGHLVRPVGIRIGTSIDLDAVTVRQGDFAPGELELAVNTSERNQMIARGWQEYARERKSIAFCVDVAHVHSLTAALRAAGAEAEAIVGTTPTVERQDIYRRFREGELNVLVSCLVLTEGWDEPSADCALMCRPTKSRSMFIQQAGRVLRKFPGKKDALLVDFVDNTAKHKLASILTLAGDAPVDREPKEKREYDIFAQVEESERRAMVRAGAERVADLLEDSSIRWVRTPKGRFVVDGPQEYVAIVADSTGQYWPISVHKGGKGWRRLFAAGADIETAMAIGESNVQVVEIAKKGAKWQDRPATAQQMEFCRRYKVPARGSMTQGQVSELITGHLADSVIDRHSIVLGPMSVAV